MTSTQVSLNFPFPHGNISLTRFCFQVSINLIVELVAGYAIPGRPIANMVICPVELLR